MWSVKIHSNIFFVVLFFLISFVPTSQAATKEEAMAKYQDVIALAEEMNVYQHDIRQTVPKIKIASEALLADKFDEANTVLEEALIELKNLRAVQPKRHSMVERLEWLEIYLDILQKFILMVFLGFLAMKLGFFNRIVRTAHLNPTDGIYLFLFTLISGLSLSLFDLKRYGDTSFFFLDFHVMITIICGFLGGLLPALFSGLAFVMFRLMFESNPGIVLSVLVVAIGSGFAHRFLKGLRFRDVLVAALVLCLVHASMVYLTFAMRFHWTYLLFSIGLVGLLEGLAVVVFFAVLANMRGEERKRETERKLLKTELLFLQSQINPHFLYNALNSIAEICAKGQLDQARELVLNLSDFFRQTAKKGHDLVPLREEVAHLDSFLEIERARFRNRLNVVKEYQIAERSWSVTVPILSLQPLVENAIKHGIEKKIEGGTVKIRITEDKENIKVEISDDGPGMNPNRAELLLKDAVSEEREEEGVGLKNIQHRLIRLWGASHGLQIQSKAGEGTNVTVSIPKSMNGSGSGHEKYIFAKGN